MNLQQQQSVLTIAMLAAFADGAKDDTEREEIRRIAQSLAAEGNMPDLPRLYQDVLLRRTSLESAAAALQDPTHRQLAYEMAVCVCDVDGRQTPAEREFLAHLNWAAPPQMPLIRKSKRCSMPWTAPPQPPLPHPACQCRCLQRCPAAHRPPPCSATRNWTNPS